MVRIRGVLSGSTLVYFLSKGSSNSVYSRPMRSIQTEKFLILENAEANLEPFLTKLDFFYSPSPFRKWGGASPTMGGDILPHIRAAMYHVICLV